ncbi:hypothetical protein [Terrimicrobium sacchariphilum]|nr:hypothetical protein [Terrimicrobium sacchariphilum]
MKSLFANVLGFARRSTPDSARLRVVTAAQIPGAEPAEVEITEVRCGNETVSWRAMYRSRYYHCHSDGECAAAMVTRVG